MLNKILFPVLVFLGFVSTAFSQAMSPQILDEASLVNSSCLSSDFLTKSDAKFAADCAEFVFGNNSDIVSRERVAWLLFARVNQLVDGLDANQKTVQVPQWMAWATDHDTFKTPKKQFIYSSVPDVGSGSGFVIPKHVLAGSASTLHPDGANEQVTRNEAAYTYLFKNELNTVNGLKTFLAPQTVTRIEMPIGSIEIKGSWLKSKPEFDPYFPPATFSFDFGPDDKGKGGGKYWLRGLHIMAKFATLGANEDVFSSENPSWFWTTFELNKNPGGAACTDETTNPKCTTTKLNPTGTEHVRQSFISQRAPFDQQSIQGFLSSAGIGNMGFENYAPNGTQIRFTLNADGKTPVILGHTDMEDFAGWINKVNSGNTHQNPAAWTKFDASCHTCHATAAFNPDTGNAYPFTVPIGKLPKNYTNTCKIKDKNGNKKTYTAELAKGYKSLDFMWPIAFQLKLPCFFSKGTG